MTFKLYTTLSLGFLILLTGCASGPSGRTRAPKTATSKPYRITNSHMKNKLFKPKQFYEHYEEGYASYYGGRDVFHGRKTSTGEIFDKNKLMAAHRTLPLPSVVRVTNIDRKSKGYGRSIKVRVVDRGPFAHINKRIIDVSEKSAKLLGFYKSGVVKVKLESLVNESLRLAKGKRFTPDKKPRTLKLSPRTDIRLALKPKSINKTVSLTATALKALSDKAPKPELSPFAHSKATKHVSQHGTQKPNLKPSYSKSPFSFAHGNTNQPYENYTPRKKPSFKSLGPPLKRAKVNTPPVLHPPATQSGIFVHTGKYQSHQKAHNLSRALNNSLKKYRVSSRALNANKNKNYTIELGPFENTDRAEQALAQLSQYGHDEAHIIYK